MVHLMYYLSESLMTQSLRFHQIYLMILNEIWNVFYLTCHCMLIKQNNWHCNDVYDGIHWDKYQHISMNTSWFTCACMTAYMVSYMNLYICMHVIIRWHVWRHTLRTVWAYKYTCKWTYTLMYDCIYGAIHKLMRMHTCCHILTSMDVYIETCMGM
jgi:hypothetical protein